MVPSGWIRIRLRGSGQLRRYSLLVVGERFGRAEHRMEHDQRLQAVLAGVGGGDAHAFPEARRGERKPAEGAQGGLPFAG
jgi:hypothetical protein